MKRLMLMISILVLSASAVLAYDMSQVANLKNSLAPLDGAYGINVGSTQYNEDIDTGKGSNGWVASTPQQGDGTYSNNSIVLMGAIYDIPYDIANDGFYIDIRINSDSGFELASVSNSSYRRPYTFTAVGKFQAGGSETLIDSKKIDGNLTSEIRLVFGDTNKDNQRDVSASETASANKIWFDLVIGLPVREVAPSGLLTLPSGEQIILGRVDDYVSFVTVTMRWGTNKGIGGERILSVPFSGYFRPYGDDIVTETASLQIDTNARSSALDIQRDSNKELEIGTLRYTQTKMAAAESSYDQDLESLRLFISASPDPFLREPDGFRLMHMDYKAGDTVNDYNSVPFTIIARSEIDGIEDVSFDGRDYVTGTLLTKSIKPKVSYDADFTHSASRYPFYAAYEGNLSIMIDYGGYTMKSGLYKENVYVHVISGITGGTT